MAMTKQCGSCGASIPGWLGHVCKPVAGAGGGVMASGISKGSDVLIMERFGCEDPHAAPLVPVRAKGATMDLDETEATLIKAWRRSGMTLGRLLVCAANDDALGGAVSLPGMADAAVARIADRYSKRNGNRSGGDHG